MIMEFTKHKRKSISELRPVTQVDIEHFAKFKHLAASEDVKHNVVSISDADLNA
jgi:hypothetical protein